MVYHVFGELYFSEWRGLLNLSIQSSEHPSCYGKAILLCTGATGLFNGPYFQFAQRVFRFDM